MIVALLCIALGASLTANLFLFFAWWAVVTDDDGNLK